jgi:hypothetical protein
MLVLPRYSSLNLSVQRCGPPGPGQRLHQCKLHQTGGGLYLQVPGVQAVHRHPGYSIFSFILLITLTLFMIENYSFRSVFFKIFVSGVWDPDPHFYSPSNQCCGSGMFIPDPGSDLSIPDTRIQNQTDSRSGSRIRIRIKNLSIFNPKIFSKLSYPGSRI